MQQSRKIDPGKPASDERAKLQQWISTEEAEVARVAQLELHPLGEKMRLAKASGDIYSFGRARTQYNKWSAWITRKNASINRAKQRLANL